MRIYRASKPGQMVDSKRRGVASVEMAFLLPFLMLIIVGVWELGRIIHVQILMNNAARDGARIAAQANIVNTTGTYTQIGVNSGTPNVEDTVKDYLIGAGITNLTGISVTFQFTSGTGTQPYQGVKNQPFRVTVTLPYDNIRWTTMGIINPTSLTAEAQWQCLVDDPFTVNTTLPGWIPPS